MGRKNTACQNCKDIKARCTKETPCGRCKRLSLHCVFRTQGPASPASSTPPRPKGRAGGVKAKHKKSVTGCLNCRQRRRKCDEKLPVCTDCSRLKLPCIRTQQSPESKGPEADGRTPRSVTAVESSKGDDGEIDRGVGPDEGEPKPEPELSIDTPLSTTQRPDSIAVFSDWQALIVEENRLSLTLSAHLAGSTALASLGLPCAVDDNDGLAAFLPSTALNNQTGVTPETLRTWTISERHLMNHWLQNVARSLVIVEDGLNPFMGFIVPMALQNTMVRHALVALAAAHLSLVYPDFDHDLEFHRSKALVALKLELDICVANEASICALAATLLFCLIEICLSTSTKHVLHLHGARALLERSRSQRVEPPMQTFIDLYNYLVCVFAITTDKTPMLFGDVIPWATPLEPALLHPFYGFAAPLYQSLHRIGQLAIRLRCAAFALEDNPEAAREATDIEHALQNWNPPIIDAVDERQDVVEARALGFAIQRAATMRLLQISKRLTNDDLRIRKASDGILSALSLVRAGSNMECRVLFPLFMAGVGAMTKPNRLSVEHRLHVMRTTVGFGNAVVAHCLLEHLWRRQNAGEVVNWEELMASDYEHLVLF